MTSPREILVQSVRGPVLVQDGGRAGVMHHAVPEGGALVPELLAASNHVVGNAWDAPAFEIFGGATFRAEREPLLLALDGMPMRLAAGEAFTVEPSHNVRVRYLAVGGGLDVPMQLDGRGTLLTASLGVFGGRALRSGDRLPILASPAATARAHTPPVFDAHAPIRIVAGPDLERFAPDALNVLLQNTFTVSTASDRVGTRLDGPLLPRIDRDDAGSRPMVRGVIEVPSGGSPIVLGPDHPTTGGYPVLAVVIRADQGAFAARRAGAPVRFRAVDVDEARAAWRVAAAEWFAGSER